ncbi:hypothetical protein KP509_03G039800 [Ceratopteris richardii]|uniref:Protein TPLATE n=1 Tax=Ceratopteris richardii TaxID=49495 RepID=A0A8T2VAS9_CERRI|nr:hypothetical protein KP509_03G039800 [Ceratopteris richardii]
MDALLAQIRTELSSNDAIRQSQALLQALQWAAAGKDMSSLCKTACEEIIASPANAVCKKLAFDLVRATRLTSQQWETVCRGIKNDFDFPDPDVTAAGVSFLAAIPSWRLGKLINDCSREISNCIASENNHLRYAITETLGCILARDDVVNLCEASAPLSDKVASWWKQIGQNMLDVSDAVSRVAFEAIGRLFSEFTTKRMSRLAGDKLISTEASLAIRSNWIISMCKFVWEKRNLLMARSLVLPLESFRSTIQPLVFAIKAVATGMVEEMQAISGGDTSPRGPMGEKEFVNAERILAVSDLVSHLVPFLSSVDPPLVFEVGVNLLSLADVPGGKPEWASASVTAILTLWDRQEFSSGKESIVKAVVQNLQLLDLHMQVSLFKRLLTMVRNLRVEADRMHALACICRTALCVDLFARESVKRGQKPLPGTDIASLFEDPRIKEDLTNVSSSSLFREELVACLVESCFQLSLPLPRQNSSGTESRVIGALAYGAGYEAMSWTQTALEVVEVCRPCIRWDCDGRTYAMDCYLKLLVRLCHFYDTQGGVKKVKDGASQEQILNETRLQKLQRELVKDLAGIATLRILARLIWALAEHFDLGGLDPLLADDPEDPLNIIVANVHKVLFNGDSPLNVATNRVQDIQAVLLCSKHLGSRYPRAAQLFTKELEEFRASTYSDSVSKHQCRLILQMFKYILKHPESSWAGSIKATGDYPFSHHKLSVQFFDASAAQDRKIENLVRNAVQELWRPRPSELLLLVTKGADSSILKSPPRSHTLSASSDPCYVEAYHLMDSVDGRLTLHMKIMNVTDQEVNQVDVRIGLVGALQFMDGSLQAVRNIQHLQSQEPISCSITVTVLQFQRCALCVQMVYYPFHGGAATGDIDDSNYGEDGTLRSQRTLKLENVEPVILRCQPYLVPLTELLLPEECSPVEFLRIWPSLAAVAEFTGAYVYEGSGFKATAAVESGTPLFFTGLKALEEKPFFKVCSHILRTVAGFQVCYTARTWHGDFLGMVIFGASEMSRNVDFGDETTTMVCKFVLRSSSPTVLDEITQDVQRWLDDLTDGALTYVTEEEVQVAAAEKLRKSMEQMAIFKAAAAARPRSPPPKGAEQEGDDKGSEEKPKEPKEPSTLTTYTAEEIEHRALQAAVLQEWEIFRAKQVQLGK